MFYNSSPDSWHALHVKTGTEDKVKERLNFIFSNKDLKIVVPKRKMKERKNGIVRYRLRTLIPGYVLMKGFIGIEEYYSLKRIPDLIKILRDESCILKIDEHEMNLVTRLMCNKEIIETSSIYMDGDRIVVVDGPLVGMEGLIESINKRKERVKVRVDFIGEARIVELSISMLQPT